MSTQPNLFKFATSELSQDAFICWLISYADPKYSEVAPALHKTGTHLLEKLLSINAGKEKPSSIQSVKVTQQLYKIDVLVVINGEYAILIEDKVNTKHHGNQLKGYFARLSKDYDTSKIHLIFFKTGDQSNYKSVQEAGYIPFLRKDILEVLEYGLDQGVENNIFQDFYQYQNSIQRRVEDFLSVPYQKEDGKANWGWYQWIGFYQSLQQHLKSGDWDYVPQKNGGFLGFWWKWQYKDYDGLWFDYYLQLEQFKFCFKICPAAGTDKADKCMVRDRYRKELFEKAKEMGISLSKNGKLGNTMTVAVFKKYIVRDEQYMVDFDKTLANIRNMESLIEAI